MRRFTTPTITLEVGADLTGCDAYLTLRQGFETLTIRLDTLDDWTVTSEGATASVTLTQRQSARFGEGKPVEVQANVIDQNGYRAATDIVMAVFDRQLLEVTKSYGQD